LLPADGRPAVHRGATPPALASVLLTEGGMTTLAIDHDVLVRPRRLDVGRLLARGMALFARVERSEAVGVLLMAATIFLLLTSYYLLKIAREPLILLGGGAEVKSYASAGQAVLLILVVKGFGALSQRVGRMRLVTIVTLFFAANLVVFFALGRLSVPLGVPFYLWVGIFKLTAIGQFW